MKLLGGEPGPPSLFFSSTPRATSDKTRLGVGVNLARLSYNLPADLAGEAERILLSARGLAPS